MNNFLINFWVKSNSESFVKILSILIGFNIYIYIYLTYQAVPGNDPNFPEGWMGWIDQSHYLAAAKDFANGSMTSSQQTYPPIYPLIGSIFYPIFGFHLYFLPNLLFFLGYCWFFIKLFSRYISPRLAIVSLLISFFHSPLLPLQWVIPWTSSLSALIIVLVFLFADRYIVRRNDDQWVAKSQFRNIAAVSLLVGLLAPIRPGDFLAVSVVLVFYFFSLIRYGLKDSGARFTFVCKNIFLMGFLSLLPLMFYLTFNKILFGSFFGGYFNVLASGGSSVSFIFDRVYGHLIDASVLFSEADADWVSRLPLLYVAIFIVPLGVFFGPVLIRLISIIILVHIILVYSYADSVPTGQFRYFNIHYMKWLLPILPVIFLYFLREFKLKSFLSMCPLIGCFILVMLSQSIKPNYQKIVPESVDFNSNKSFILKFAQPKMLSYVEVPGLYAPIGEFNIRQQRVRVNNSEFLVPLRDVRPTPSQHGMRFLFSKPMYLSSVEIEPKGIGDIQRNIQQGVIGVFVDYQLSIPWIRNKPKHPTPLAPLLDLDNPYLSAANYTKGWSGSETWGRWMDGKSAMISFSLSDKATAGIGIKIEGIGFVAGSQSVVIVDVYSNSIKLGEMHISDDKSHIFTFDIPRSVYETKKEINLNLYTRTTLSPFEAGLSADSRQLSFGLIRLEVWSLDSGMVK
jgi:hypothetical protein